MIDYVKYTYNVKNFDQRKNTYKDIKDKKKAFYCSKL